MYVKLYDFHNAFGFLCQMWILFFTLNLQQIKFKSNHVKCMLQALITPTYTQSGFGFHQQTHTHRHIHKRQQDAGKSYLRKGTACISTFIVFTEK